MELSKQKEPLRCAYRKRGKEGRREGGRKGGRKEGEKGGREEERKERRKEGKKEGRKEGREGGREGGRKEGKTLLFVSTNSTPSMCHLCRQTSSIHALLRGHLLGEGHLILRPRRWICVSQRLFSVSGPQACSTSIP